jgi:hypothetical protein
VAVEGGGVDVELGVGAVRIRQRPSSVIKGGWGGVGPVVGGSAVRRQGGGRGRSSDQCQRSTGRRRATATPIQIIVGGNGHLVGSGGGGALTEHTTGHGIGRSNQNLVVPLLP